MPSHFSCVQHSATLWNVACQTLLYVGFSRQEPWSGLPRPNPMDLPHSGFEPILPTLAGRFFTTNVTCEYPSIVQYFDSILGHFKDGIFNPYQATNGIFRRTRTNNFIICIEIQKASNSQSNLEKEEWNWRNQPAWLQALLQSHSHQDSIVLAQRQKYRSVEQNRKPRD